MKLSTDNFEYHLQGDISQITSNKLIIATVGLPGLGKSYFSKNLKKNYTKLNKNLNVKVFNAGERRRTGKKEKQDAEWFKKQGKIKEQIAIDTLKEAIKWLNGSNNYCAIFDATNSTLERRRNVYNLVKKCNNIDMIFVEIMCDNKKIIKDNILHKVKSSPNYKDMKQSNALINFEKRIDIYKKVYKTIDKSESEYSYIKTILGKCMKHPKKKGKIICNNINPFFWVVDYIDNIPNYLKKDEKKSKQSSYS
jgi:6-phosphofructo-2-kinase/fructose-2,6-biphosphatase 2